VEKEVRYNKRKDNKTHCMPSGCEDFLFYLVIHYAPTLEPDEIPTLPCLVITSACHSLSIRLECNRPHKMFVSCPPSQQLTCASVPYPQMPILISGNDITPIRAKCNRIELTANNVRKTLRRSVSYAPNANCMIPRSRGKKVTIRREVDTLGVHIVSSQDGTNTFVFDIPDLRPRNISVRRYIRS
jgi:hypothetical protein